mmetsp:Transcript_22381/g.47230  ORF Transcript_22381/g.47230 Transcript_22381/m.47230 type:complete len:256 (+) Transcript_22381:529-1296(+)
MVEIRHDGSFGSAISSFARSGVQDAPSCSTSSAWSVFAQKSKPWNEHQSQALPSISLVALQDDSSPPVMVAKRHEGSFGSATLSLASSVEYSSLQDAPSCSTSSAWSPFTQKSKPWKEHQSHELPSMSLVDLQDDSSPPVIVARRHVGSLGSSTSSFASSVASSSLQDAPNCSATLACSAFTQTSTPAKEQNSQELPSMSFVAVQEVSSPPVMVAMRHVGSFGSETSVETLSPQDPPYVLAASACSKFAQNSNPW